MADLEQGNLFRSRPDEEPEVESWSRVVARRMQSMLMGFPVHQMVAKGESGYYPEWQDQNFTFLALQVFDSVFARMAPGLGRGATREQIIHDIRDYILAAQPKLTDNDVENIVDFVLNHLLNDGKGVFEQECVWLDETNRPQPFMFRYGLLQSFHDPETDQFIIRATPEAIHLYLRMLDQPLEDEQVANMAVLHEQVRRGRISRSRREAERTMLLSLEYERYIENMLRSVRRDVRSVDWVREVSPKIEEAHNHVQRLIRDQGMVLKDLKRELQRNQDHARLHQIHALIDVLEVCQRRHMELERRILSAGPSYLEEQAYQRFRSMARSPMPDLNEQVFLPALTVKQSFLAPKINDLLHLVMGPSIHRILDLELLVERLLRDEAPDPPRMEDEDQLERIPVQDLYNPLADDIEEKTAEVLTLVGEEPMRLSELLAYGRELEMGTPELSIIGVSLLHSYHARSDLLGVTVSVDGKPLEDPEFMGDDLVIVRRAESL